MQVNGQCQQVGQLQFTHPQLSYNANGSNQGYENNMSYNRVGALVGHYTMDNVGVKQQHTQRQNNFLVVNNPLQASSHQDCYLNSAQNAANQNNTPSVSLNRQTSMSGNPQSAVLHSNVAYYQSQVLLQKMLNQSLNPRLENVSVPMTKPTTSPTTQHMCYTQQQQQSQQSAVQSSMYSQTSQQAAYAPHTSAYSQNVNVAFSNVPNPQNVQIYSFTPVTLLSTSCVNKVVSNHQSVQNNYVSQTNDNRALHSENGSAPLSNRMVTNNPNNQSNSLTAFPAQTQYSPYQCQKNVHQTSVRGNINMQTAQPIIPATNDNYSLNTSPVLVPSQTCMQKSVGAESNLKNMSVAPLLTTTPTKDYSVRHLDNSLFYRKMNEVTNNLSLCTPRNQASELSRSEVFGKTETVSSAQSKESSPGRATRAVAVVLPLSQENSPSKRPSPSGLSSSNPASGSGFFSSNQLDKAPVQTPDTLCLKPMLQRSTSSTNISTDKANANAPSSSLIQKQLSQHDSGNKLSTLPLTFAQLVRGSCSTKLSGRQKSKSGNRKTPTVQKPCEEELSSLPTTEWTLKMLRNKILELENEGLEQKKSENKQSKYDPITQLVLRFWNGDCKALLHEARNGTLRNEMFRIRDICSKYDVEKVIFSQNQNSLPSKCHVLLHDEVYEEKTTYISSWLNINQLDDIDKEFDLPYFFKYGKNGCKSVDSEPKGKLEEAAIPKPEELKNKEDPSKTHPNPICSIPPVNSLSNNTEKHNTLAHLDPDTEKTTEENKCVSNAQSNDPSYSIKIEVLPPEEAKVIFEQVECDSPQIRNTAVSEEIPASDQDNAENQTYHVPTIEKICCIEKWKERVFGLSSESKCKCEEQSQDDENLGELVNKNCPMGTVDLTENDDFPIFTQESENILENKSHNKSTITVSGESEDESHDSENNHATHADSHEEYEQDSVISTERKEDIGTNKDLLENSNVNENEMTTSGQSEQTQDCRKELEESGAGTTEAAKPASSQPVSGSHDVKENKRRSASDNSDPLLRPFKKPKLSSHLKSQTILESFSKCKNSGNVETVELALFGSKNKKWSSDNCQQSQYSDAYTPLFEETEEAPRRLYVKFSPFTKSDKVSEPWGNSSVKKRIHENWRNSFPPTRIRLKGKKKFAIVGANHGTTVHLKSVNHKDKPAASKRKIQDSDGGQGREKKRSRKGGKAVNILKEPVDAEVRPHQGNVLKFNVLPNTFNFEDGSTDRDSTTDSTTEEKTVPVPAEGNPPSAKTKGAWCDKSTSKSSPQSPTVVPESVGLFQEFQRRYKMRQASTDE